MSDNAPLKINNVVFNFDEIIFVLAVLGLLVSGYVTDAVLYTNIIV